MKQFLEFALTQMLDHPDDVRVTVSENDDAVVVSLTVHPEDMGKIIGKEGRTINAIRSLAKIIATKEKKKLQLNLAS